MFFGGSLERTEIKPGTNIPAAYLAYAEQLRLHQQHGPAPSAGRATTATAALTPTSGRLQRVSGEWGAAVRRALPAGQLPVPAVPADHQAVHLAFNGELGWGEG